MESTAHKSQLCDLLQSVWKAPSSWQISEQDNCLHQLLADKLIEGNAAFPDEVSYRHCGEGKVKFWDEQ